MPIFMDRHDISEKVTAGNVANLHQQDLKVQHLFNCKALTYWFDEKRRTAFCLIEAPDKKAIEEMHRTAHGDIPNQIIEVKPDIVESFLGRIKDPEPKGSEEYPLIDDSAFRILLKVGFHPDLAKKRMPGGGQFNLQSCLKTFADVIGRFNGHIAKQHQCSILASFQSVSNSILCALELDTVFEDLCDELNCRGVNLKVGMCAGVPLTSKLSSFFEDAVKMTDVLFSVSNEKIIITDEVKHLYEDENQDVVLPSELFQSLSLADQKFLISLMSYMSESWQNSYLQVDDLAQQMGYSKSQLYRKMMSLLGVSPSVFIKDYRLEKALGLIRKQSGNIAEIAYETGFNSPSYFSKCFLNKYRVHPSKYFNAKI